MRALFIILFYMVFFVPSAFSRDWTGFYNGWILGAQVSNSNDKTGAFGYNEDNDEWDYTDSGFNAALEFGYNYLWHWLVVGPEIELGYLGMHGSGTQPASPGFDTVGKNSSDFYTAFRARVGLDLNSSLIFATGGAIGVNETKQVIDSCYIAPCGGSTVDAQKNSFTWGYTVGGGIEHLLKNDWSVKLEYLYFSLESQRFSGITNLGITYDWTGQTSGHIVRAGLIHHF